MNRGSVLGLGLIALVGFAIVGAGTYWGMQKRETLSSSQDNLSESKMPLTESQKPEQGIKVLFVGNSFTYFNDMPQMVSQLAKSNGEPQPFLAVQEAPGGFTFSQHVSKGKVAALLKSTKWDYVVLQEQSQFLSFEQWQRFQEVHVPARQLNMLIYNNGAKPIVFMTWGYRDGDLMNKKSDSYLDMQNRLNTGYTDLAKDLSAVIAPVGIAWQQSLARKPGLNLWDADGKHPNPKGSYLAACVFYGLFYGKSPVGNAFRGNLDAVEAYFLQSVAATSLQNAPPLAGGKE
jgi:hypothetical protein